MLTESFDDGLSVLRHLMRWHLIDMAYVTVNESKKVKSSWRSTDGNLIEGRRPRFDDLPREVGTLVDPRRNTWTSLLFPVCDMRPATQR